MNNKHLFCFNSPVRDSILVNDRWGIGVPCHHGDVRNCHDMFDPCKLGKLIIDWPCRMLKSLYLG